MSGLSLNPPTNADPTVMADVDTSAFRFNISTPSCKRKRPLDHPEDDGRFVVRDAKRRSTSTHCLPIRLSPSSRPHVSVPPASYSLFTSIYQQPPTPVDTSDDDESSGQSVNGAEGQWPLANNDSQLGSDRRTASTKSQFSDPVDVEMDLTMAPPATQPRIRRARSNDIVPPERDPNFLSAMDTFARERVPTPISGHFDNRVNDLPNVPRHHFPPLRTNLSPMIEQESWITRDGLPSPVEDQDMDTAMMIDRDEFATQVQSPSGKYGMDGNSSPSGRTRSARLHMGYLNDCEKCIQKVPGHYSHIIWT
ncbi:uncharacterized protein Z520_03258 [Fonsecaea multimorphosa CBS 102226]|uniref:Uncharacterized protein n=1 Tax=Fonsecaea multimorphosa CBS 102226 TaxID=1442371 RepID=A0A0D2KBX2_9EURO|nr:uncharacterized protein Z520_03258 [Fonsecaea multimorphosa CBS 102226]KIY00595.1 hypothetical protein Z520_03258 [Fonsecaea multimorphosa CBS 102226]OAL18987.1 hypothetical protein AYO22_10316 [Fonsecaea multimorphosa]